MRQNVIVALLSVGLVVLHVSPLPAQNSSPNGHIVVQVTDVSGAIVPSARVLVLPTPAMVKSTHDPDDRSEFHFDVPPGTYDFRVRSHGFISETKRAEVKSGTVETISFALTPAGCASQCVPLPREMTAVRGDFPERSEIKSPDGRYVILAGDHDSSTKHIVFFEDTTLQTRRLLLTYDQHMSLLWHANSKVFAVTNYVTDDNSDCEIYFVGDIAHPIPVLERLSRELPDAARENLEAALSSHRAYVEGEDWVEPTSLILTISPHTGFQAGSGYGSYKLDLELATLPVNSRLSENHR
jgi:carboxypeptidase family protein